MTLGSHRITKVPILPTILLVISAIFLSMGLIAYVQPTYDSQTPGYIIPGGIIGAIGLAFFFRQLRARLAI